MLPAEAFVGGLPLKLTGIAVGAVAVATELTKRRRAAVGSR